jgi:hypothetical protein
MGWCPFTLTRRTRVHSLSPKEERIRKKEKKRKEKEKKNPSTTQS